MLSNKCTISTDKYKNKCNRKPILYPILMCLCISHYLVLNSNHIGTTVIKKHLILLIDNPNLSWKFISV